MTCWEAEWERQFFWRCSFLNYSLCYYSCPKFSPFDPLQSALTSLRQSLQHCPSPWVIHICSLATLFPMLYNTSPWLFCNYLFVLFNPFTFFTHPSQPPSHLPTIKTFPASVILFLLCLFCYLDSIVDRYVFIAILLFIFLILSKSL